MIRTRCAISGCMGIYGKGLGSLPALQTRQLYKYLVPYTARNLTQFGSVRFHATVRTNPDICFPRDELCENLDLKTEASEDFHNEFEKLEQLSLKPLVDLCKEALKNPVDSSIQKQQMQWIRELCQKAMKDSFVLDRISNPRFHSIFVGIFSIKDGKMQSSLTASFLSLSEPQLETLESLILEKANGQAVSYLRFARAGIAPKIVDQWIAFLRPETIPAESSFRHSFRFLTQEVSELISLDSQYELGRVQREHKISRKEYELTCLMKNLEELPLKPEEFVSYFLREMIWAFRDERIYTVERVLIGILQALNGSGLKSNLLKACLDNFDIRPEVILENIQNFRFDPGAGIEIIALCTRKAPSLSGLSQFVSRFENILLKTDNLSIQRLQYVWLISMIFHFFTNNKNVFWLDPKFAPLLDEICAIRKESTQTAVTYAFLSQTEEMIRNTKQFLEGRMPHQLVVSFLFSHLRIDSKIAERCLNSLQPKFYKNGLIMIPIIELLALMNGEELSIFEKERIISFVLESPIKMKGQKEEEYKKRIDDFRKNQKQVINLITNFLLSQCYDELKNFRDFEVLLERQKKMLCRIFNSSEEDMARLIEIFQTSKRYPGALFIYACRLQLLESEEKEYAQDLLAQLAKSVLEGRFLEKRYNLENPHLHALFSDDPDLLSLWKTSISRREIKDSNGKIFTLQDSDDVEDLLLSGTEVAKSCLNILGVPTYNKCLLSMICDGKIKLMTLKDSAGRIVARANLRVLQDNTTKKPVLFVDKIYTQDPRFNKELEALIYLGCREKAKQMRIPLTSASLPGDQGQHPTVYPGTLESLHGGLYEYVDALAGVQNGAYTLGDVCLDTGFEL